MWKCLKKFQFEIVLKDIYQKVKWEEVTEEL